MGFRMGSTYKVSDQPVEEKDQPKAPLGFRPPAKAQIKREFSTRAARHWDNRTMSDLVGRGLQGE